MMTSDSPGPTVSSHMASYSEFFCVCERSLNRMLPAMHVSIRTIWSVVFGIFFMAAAIAVFASLRDSAM